jgi:hypothetical protein
MKILFIARHYTYFRNFDAAIRELAARGHELHLAVEKDETFGGAAAVAALARTCDRITYGPVPERRVDTWSGVARRLRLGLDYLRYLDPFYDFAPGRRVRARSRTPRLLIALADPPLVRGERWRRFVGKLLQAFDASVPPPDTVVEFIRGHAPDAVVITPLVDLGSQQIDYVRAARQLRIPSALAVWSWDHLTSKAYLREYPQRVLVWNETQRGEAVNMHRVPPERVVVTGAQCFDHWFGRSPSRTREELCEQLGLAADRPLVLWVGSGLMKGSPPEPPVVQEWLGWVRQSGDPVIANAAVLLRPHPQHARDWEGIDWRAYGNVAIWGSSPVDERSRADYFDSLYHSDVVVGLNTSAFIEAGIVGREVLSLLVSRFRDSQEGTAHFRYLLQIGGGLLRASREHDEHLAQLGEALRRTRAAGEHPHRAFLEAFVRPYGIDEPATPRFVAAIESLKDCAVTEPAASGSTWLRAVLGVGVRVASQVAGESLIRSPRELEPERLARIAAARREQDALQQRK